MAGSLTVNEHIAPKRNGILGKLKCTWTSDGSGNVNGNDLPPINGLIVRVATNPTNGPTTHYDIVLNDEDGIDVMDGDLTNRHATTSEQVIPTSKPAVAGVLTPVVTNAGVSKTGVIQIYYSR